VAKGERKPAKKRLERGPGSRMMAQLGSKAEWGEWKTGRVSLSGEQTSKDKTDSVLP